MTDDNNAATQDPPPWKIPDFDGKDGTTRTEQFRDKYPPVSEDVSQNVSFVDPPQYDAPQKSYDDSIRNDVNKPAGTAVGSALTAAATNIIIPNYLPTAASGMITDPSQPGTKPVDLELNKLDPSQMAQDVQKAIDALTAADAKLQKLIATLQKIEKVLKELE